MTFLKITEWTSREVSAFLLQQGNHAALNKLALEARKRNIDGATLASMASSQASLQRLFHSWGCPVPKPLGRQLFMRLLAANGSEETPGLASNPGPVSARRAESTSSSPGTAVAADDETTTDTSGSAAETFPSSGARDAPSGVSSRAPSSTCDMTAGSHAVKVPGFFKAWMQAKSSLWAAQDMHVRDLAILMDEIQHFYHQSTRSVFSGGRAFAEAVAKLVLGVPQHVFLSLGQALQKMRSQGLVHGGGPHYSPGAMPDDVAYALEFVRCECNKLHSLRLDQHHHATKPQVVECLLTVAEFVLDEWCQPASTVNNNPVAAGTEHHDVADVADVADVVASALAPFPQDNDSDPAEGRRGPSPPSPVASACTSAAAPKTYHSHVFGVLSEGTGFFDEHVFTTIDTRCSVEEPSFGNEWEWNGGRAGMSDEEEGFFSIIGNTEPRSLATLFKTAQNGSADKFHCHHEALQGHHAAMQHHDREMAKFQKRFANFGGFQAS